MIPARTECILIAMVTPTEIASLLGLKPHPAEGGYFVETYRSDESLEHSMPHGRYDGPRSMGTAIYYMVTADSFSAMHRLRSDEVFHFYLGDPVEMIQLLPDGSGRVFTLGQDIQAGMRPQALVVAGTWQGLRLIPGGSFALLGTTVSPGFDFADYEHGSRKALVKAYPDFEGLIVALTREDR